MLLEGSRLRPTTTIVHCDSDAEASRAMAKRENHHWFGGLVKPVLWMLELLLMLVAQRWAQNCQQGQLADSLHSALTAPPQGQLHR